MDNTRFIEHLPKLVFNEMQQGTDAFRAGALDVLDARNAQEVKCAVREIMVRHERDKMATVECKEENERKQSEERRSTLRNLPESDKYRESITALLNNE